MQTELETELKTMLSKTDFDYLLKKYQLDQPTIQINYYLDTSNKDLKKHHYALRIRQIVTNNHWELTLKIPQNKQQNIEHTKQLNSKQSQDFFETKTLTLPKELVNFLPFIDNKQLVVFAELKTTRYTHQINKHMTIMLDHSEYYLKNDFELEIEFHNITNPSKLFTDFLTAHRIKYNKAEPKILRALAAKTV